MKRYNYLYVCTILFSMIFLGACQSDEESFDNKVYINASSKVDNLLIKASVVNEERVLQAAIAQPENQDIVVTYSVDSTDLVKQYNEAYYDKAVYLRSKFYKLPEPKVTIQAGSVQSTQTTIYFNNINELDRDTVYVLPVTIASANIGILKSAQTTYYVFKGAALINVVADMEDNYLHIDKWVNPAPLRSLTSITMETLIRNRNFDRMISTVMGIEGKFLIRLGDAGFPSNQIQIATTSGNFPDGDSNKGLPVNEWVHLAFTYDAGTKEWKIYINGKIQSEGIKNLSTINLAVDGVDGFYIGRSYEDSRYIAGEFSECRIWNIARTQEDIANNIYEVDAQSEGLVAYWKCDEGGGNIVKDHTANGNNLTSKRNITWTKVSLPESRK